MHFLFSYCNGNHVVSLVLQLEIFSQLFFCEALNQSRICVVLLCGHVVSNYDFLRLWIFVLGFNFDYNSRRRELFFLCKRVSCHFALHLSIFFANFVVLDMVKFGAFFSLFQGGNQK